MSGTADQRRPLVVHHEPAGSCLVWQVGEVSIARVEEGVIEVPRHWLLPGVTDDQLAACRGWIDPFFSESGERMMLSIHTFVVRTGALTIVVDTCIGDTTARPLPGDGDFLGRLASAIPGGLAGVDVVICTHLHFDHVGWNTRRVDSEWVPTFPNARYLVTHDELAHTRDDDHMAVMDPSVTPLVDAGVLDAVASDHRIDDRVRLAPSPGHTPGHVCVVVESMGETAIITGDMAHSPVQFAYPELAATAHDADSIGSTATRREFVAANRDAGTLVLGTHFAPPTAGRIRTDGSARTWFDTSTAEG
jgi:glyoxylase-like metal-dependent hydrolase (beta-lactamase superfamily II)